MNQDHDRLANSPYKIWDWDQEKTPYTREEVIQRMVEQYSYYSNGEITDDEIDDNDYGRASFISNLIIKNHATPTTTAASAAVSSSDGHDDDDEIRFWRRKDILVPGQQIEIPSKLVQVHLLKEKPIEHRLKSEKLIDESDEEQDQEDEESQTTSTETIENQDRCIYIGGALSRSECTELINSTEKLGYEEIDKEYPKEYRNSQRVLVKSKKLAEMLWSRIVPHLKKSDFKGVKPYGFDNGGLWIPSGINECMRFNKYSHGTFFKPHTDAQFVKNDDEKSIFTLLVYLNDSRSGTSLLKKVGECFENDNVVMDFKKLATVYPTVGSAAIFNHDLYHAGEKVWYMSKYVVRTEIIFKRIDKDSIYRMDYRNTEEFKRVKKLIDDSYELERKEDLTQSTIKYIQAMNIQTSLSHSIKRITNRKLSFIEETLPEEVFLQIFSYLTDEQVCQSILPINSDFNTLARDEKVWHPRYIKKWSSETLGKAFVDRTVKCSDYDTYTPKIEVSETFHSRENQIINSLLQEAHDWYNAYSTRASMEKYFNAVLLDLGRHTYKYGLANMTNFLRSMTAFGVPNHPHFYLPSYGFDDILSGDRFYSTQYHCNMIKFLNDKSGRPKKKLLKVFLHQLYKDDLRVKLQEHPLVMAVPPTWTREYMEKVEKVVFSLGIPAVYFVDSMKLLALYYQKPTSLIIDVTPYGCVCAPVIDCELKQECMAMFETDMFGEYMKSNNDMDYYECLFREQISEFLKIAPCSKEEDEIAFEDFVNRLEPFEWTSYMTGAPTERVLIAENYYSNVLETIKKSLNAIQSSEFSSTMVAVQDDDNNNKVEQINNTILSNILVVGGFSALEGFRERLKKDLSKLITATTGNNNSEESFTFREGNSDFEIRTAGVKICIVGQDMDVVGGARIVANLANFRQLCKYKPQDDH